MENRLNDLDRPRKRMSPVDASRAGRQIVSAMPWGQRCARPPAVALGSGERPTRRGTPQPTHRSGFRPLPFTVARLPIRIEQECTLHTCEKVLSLARAHRLSSHDASYLELAMRHSRDLCTLDDRLLHAAAAAGVDVVR